jgi:hypothetical protein
MFAMVFFVTFCLSILGLMLNSKIKGLAKRVEELERKTEL